MKIKYLIYCIAFFIVLFLTLRLTILAFRLPSYTIQTNGNLYIVNKLSKNIQVFDLFHGREIAEIPIDMISHEAVTTIDEHSIVATNYGSSNENDIKVINTNNNKIEKTIKLKGNIKVNGIVALRKAHKVGVIDYVNNTLLVLNIQTDSIEKKIQTKQKKSTLLVLHPDKEIAYVTNINSSSISAIDLNLNQVIKIIPCGLGRKGIAITPDGSELWVTNTKENSITVINTANYKVTNTLMSGNGALKLKFSKDGAHCLVVNAIDGTIYVYNQHSKKKIKTIILRGKTTVFERILYHTPRPVNILMHPNGLYAFVSNSNAHKIEVLDMKTLTIVSTIGTGKVPDALIFVE